MILGGVKRTGKGFYVDPTSGNFSTCLLHGSDPSSVFTDIRPDMKIVRHFRFLHYICLIPNA